MIRSKGSVFDEDRPNDQFADEDSDDRDQNDDSGSPLQEQEYSQKLAKKTPEKGIVPFESTAEKSKEKYILLRADAAQG